MAWRRSSRSSQSIFVAETDLEGTTNCVKQGRIGVALRSIRRDRRLYVESIFHGGIELQALAKLAREERVGRIELRIEAGRDRIVVDRRRRGGRVIEARTDITELGPHAQRPVVPAGDERRGPVRNATGMRTAGF